VALTLAQSRRQLDSSAPPLRPADGGVGWKASCYLFDDFAADLSERDQTRIAKDRHAVLSGKEMLIFVRDEDQQKMISYSFKR
jgi:hypothetical protein